MNTENLDFSEMSKDAILLPDGDTAKPITVEGWVSRSGKFYMGSEAERLSRWDGATHVYCSSDGCNKAASKVFTKCDDCRALSEVKRFKALKSLPLSFPVCIFDSDTYFFELDYLRDYVFENEVHPNDLRLVHCDRVKFREVDTDHFLEELHEDAELPEDLAEKINELNDAIRKSKTDSWLPNNTAVSFDADDEAKLMAAYEASQKEST